LNSNRLTRDELVEILRKEGLDDPRVIAQVNAWIRRGDAVAIYRNHDLGSPQAGHVKLVSFGGPAAQIEADEPPTRLPDIGSDINWRYHLEHTYVGVEPI